MLDERKSRTNSAARSRVIRWRFKVDSKVGGKTIARVFSNMGRHRKGNRIPAHSHARLRWSTLTL